MDVLCLQVLRIMAILNKIRGPVAFVIIEFDCMWYSRAKCVVILEHCFASKLCTAVCEAFSNVCPDKEVPSMTIH
jgi:hypothetical protein